MSTPQSSHTSLSPRAEEFIASVLNLGPRLAVFDCDGTLWSGDAGERFFYWEMERGLLPEDVARWAKARYDDYRAGRVSEEQMCGEMVTIHAGLACAMLERAAAEFFAARIVPRIFPEMAELTRRLADAGCELWAISSTNDWVVRAGAARFCIPAARVIAACVENENGRCTDRLIRVPTDELKAAAIHELLPRLPDAVLGNSVHDLAMMELTKHAFAINPNPDLEKIARQRRWTVYRPEDIKTLRSQNEE
ncbi:MAG: haloacid dehalogenase-like hydrolase [Acidobacteriia bacterium]|nr:haloacid dehalogenase-like hydrolase [Terriglobia bacterium]